VDYIPHSPEEIKSMLEELGIDSLDDLVALAVPEKARTRRKLNLEKPLSEAEVAAHLETLAARNASSKGFLSFAGAGAYHHFVPAVVDAIISRPEFFTAYTPYQPEASQGTLAAIFEFQTIIAELTGFEIANASMYDGPTALAEAVLMARRLSSKPYPGKVLVFEPLHPVYKKVLATYLEPHEIAVQFLSHTRGVPDHLNENKIAPDCFAAVISQPGFYGTIYDYRDQLKKLIEAGVLTIVVHDPHLLALLEPPGKLGADICVGEAQPLGNHLNFGGPLLGFMATKKEYLRQLPGRLVGETVDADGNRVFVMTLQTREQHIRREKATSNICTNEALCALAATVYASWLGPQGFRELSKQILLKTDYLYEKFEEIRKVHSLKPCFKDVVVELNGNAEELVDKCIKHGVIAGVPLSKLDPELPSNLLMVSVTEVTLKDDIDMLARIIAEEDR